ncbi:MAG: hypothetical protein SFY80_04255 [Verrucomicrobiota bacterium]|nr:hypothetical protein [Verrucomicrobiota bacterium]
MPFVTTRRMTISTRRSTCRLWISTGTLLLANLVPCPLWAAAFLENTTWQVDAAAEVATTQDITLAQGTFRGTATHADTRLDITINQTGYLIDYEPAPFELKYADFSPHDSQSINETQTAVQARLREVLGPRFTLMGSLGGYQGYADFRDVWLAEYYRQKFSGFTAYSPRVYTEPNPRGWNLSSGVRMEYLPGLGFAQIDIAYASTEIVPSYVVEVNPATGTAGLTIGNDAITTTAATLTLENIVSRYTRWKNTFSVTDTTAREKRYSLGTAMNIALGEYFVFRPELSWVTEEPNYTVKTISGTLEYELSAHWQANLAARYYTDTGEKLNDGLNTTAAPALRSSSYGGGLRWVGDNLTVSLQFSHVVARYEARNVALDSFQPLFRNRQWHLVQMACTIPF